MPGTEPAFTTNFDSYVCDDDTITCTVGPFTCTATVHRDDDESPPWKRNCGHGPVSDWTSRAKRPGERILSEDRTSKRYYDFAEAVKTARSDGWDTEPYMTGTAGQRATRAAERDFAVLKAWCDDEWWYCGIAVTVECNGVELTDTYDHALWGVECNYPNSKNEYLAEVANELLGDAIDAAKAKLAELAKVALP
jgi:hypothetical protein